MISEFDYTGPQPWWEPSCDECGSIDRVETNDEGERLCYECGKGGSIMTTEEKSWDRETKDHWVSTMKEHRDADRLVRGEWLGEKDESGIFRGCFFGCAMQTREKPLEKSAEAMKLPLWLIKLAELIFESMSIEKALDFPVPLVEAIPCGVSLKGVYHSTSVLRLESLLDAIPEEEK